jgi:uncharacterized membrane protein YfcA
LGTKINAAILTTKLSAMPKGLWPLNWLDDFLYLPEVLYVLFFILLICGVKSYHVRGVPMGFLLMVVAGVLSGLLGIGSGAVKVLAMDKAMKLPFKVSTTTSNFMIGVTAGAGAGVYLSRGYIDPGLAIPVMLGVLAGSLTSARELTGAKVHVLRVVFAILIGALAIEMIYSGLTGRILCEPPKTTSIWTS